MLEIRRRNKKFPVAAVLLSPYADLTFSGESYTRKMQFSIGMTMDGLHGIAKTFLRDTDPKEPLASPVFADLEGLPPLLIHAGGIEVFVDDAITLAKNAEKAEVEVELEIWDGMPHVFQSFGENLPESNNALHNIAYFINKKLN